MQVEKWQRQTEIREPRVIGTRQKLALWSVLLMMCAVFFALGYGARILSERDGPYFLPRTETSASSTVSGRTEAAGQPTPEPSHGASMIPRGAILLQVAASPRESDALTMAGVLQQKGFAVLVLEPTADKFYRVEVGPFH